MYFLKGDRVAYVYTLQQEQPPFLGTVTDVLPGKRPYLVNWDNGSSEQRYDANEILLVMRVGDGGMDPDALVPAMIRLVTITVGSKSGYPVFDPQPDYWTLSNAPLAEHAARNLSLERQCVVVLQHNKTHAYVYRAFCGVEI